MKLYNSYILFYPHFKKVVCCDRIIKTVYEKGERSLYELLKTDVKVRKKPKSVIKDIRSDSKKRSITKMYDIALLNDFKYFITLTYDPNVIDRYDDIEVRERFANWCKNMVYRYGMNYLAVAERHKDGAIHFHLFAFFTKQVDFSFSGKKDNKGNCIYNFPLWLNGFSTAIKLYGDYERSVNYLVKYVRKQNGERIFGSYYFAGGSDLVRNPLKEYDFFDYDLQPGKEYKNDFLKIKYTTFKGV